MEVSMDDEKKEISFSSGDDDQEVNEETSVFDFDQALQAIKALQEYAGRKLSKPSKDSATDLFSDDRFLYFDVVMKKYPRHLPPVTYIETVLPHPFHNPQTATSCIIVRDLDKHPLRLQDRDHSSRIYKEFFDEKQHFTEFTQVLSASQLKTEYKTFEDRRKLCQSYDIFVADKRLRGGVVRWLGKEFVQAKKVPFVMNVTKNVKRNFRRVFKLTRAILTPSTLKFKVKIGRVNQPADDLLANLKAVKKTLTSSIPGSWRNVRSAYVSVPACLDLAVYVDWGSSNLIKFPKPIEKEEDFPEDHYLDDEDSVKEEASDDD